MAIFWTLLGVTAIIVTVLVVAAHGRRSAEWAFTGFEPQSGWPDGWSFCIGLLQAAYGLSASGMVTSCVFPLSTPVTNIESMLLNNNYLKKNSMCEEVHQPAIQVPKALVGGVLANFAAGLFYLLPLNFILPDIQMLANLVSAQPVPTIIYSATGNSAGAFCLLIPLIALGLICGVGCVTAASRCTWAFARDGAIPGSRWFREVNPQLEIPLNAMMLGMVIELLLGLIYFGSTAAFNAFSGVGVIFLTLSYAMPFSMSLILRRHKDIKNASFHLGALGVFCNVVCLGECHPLLFTWKVKANT